MLPSAAFRRLFRDRVSGREHRAFLEGHSRAIAYFDGLARTILYDNTGIAVKEIIVGPDAFLNVLTTDDFGRTDDSGQSCHNRMVVAHQETGCEQALF